MARKDYQRKLDELRSDVVSMSDLVLDRYNRALTTMETKDEPMAQSVIEGDEDVNQLYLDLESDCIELFALQQPVAGDLRFIASTFKIITDLERIGDFATNLAGYAIEAEQNRYSEIDISYIGTEAGAMVGDAMAAYADADADRAREIAARDDRIDRLCEEAGEAVMQDLIETQYNDNIEAVVEDASRLLLTVRDLERVSDHAVNICARTVYMAEHDDELIY
ncbi:PhoU domain protein (plasmid) [Natronomonas pharaonis DSM 2160]|uniref:Phosphate-specific transport system accessory protein PhoU n=1 Tax=Natronomonas pharaonis (strain ATCC 35678 / DSM 2160 / CIP 103997 / JCM 8858 / NBRC 14720 / NCIMB 2260 / Gabara) TaxID=348780 RepID=Q3IM37_NATPD|nr:phosphate signaling complex protein PhoU [Natronomonas pharaonis]CAI50828.1 PhoU domain protein [Natronomonas pharaonis DSM 2160]